MPRRESDSLGAESETEDAETRDAWVGAWAPSLVCGGFARRSWSGSSKAKSAR